MKKFIIIIYNVEGSDQNIKDNIKLLGAWFNYMPSSFLLLTTLSVQETYNRIGTNKTGDRFLIMEVDLKAYWGILPKDAWDWIKEKSAQQGKR